MDIEFTVECGRFFILQCRAGKRTGEAAIKIARDVVAEGEALWLLPLQPRSLVERSFLRTAHGARGASAHRAEARRSAPPPAVRRELPVRRRGGRRRERAARVPRRGRRRHRLLRRHREGVSVRLRPITILFAR